MQQVSIGEIDSEVDSATVKRSLTSALGLTDVAINYYELAPGDSFAYGYHSHEAQEEVFLIGSGTVEFETEGGPVSVGAGEAIRFGPGEYQRGTNRGEKRVEAFAIGAPQDGGDSDIRRYCERCEERTSQDIETAAAGDVKRTRCLECGDVTGEFTRSSQDAEPSSE